MKGYRLSLGLFLLSIYTQSAIAENCPTNVAPGMYTIQIMVTDSEKRAIGQVRKLGFAGWAYKSTSGLYHVMSGHFEHAELADRSLERLLEEGGMPTDAFIIKIKPENILRGVCS